MNKKYVGLILILIIVLITGLWVINISNEDNNSPEIDDNNLFAIYLETSKNTDNFRKTKNLPKKNDNYQFSYASCSYYNDKSNKITNSNDLISYEYDGNDGVIVVNTDKAITCDLYFTLKS